MYNVGLILEGGGMRGAYTCGVLDFFMDKQIDFSSIYGVSAGACHGCSYISKQRGRAFDILYKYAGDKRYMGMGSLLKTGCFFNYDFSMHQIPESLHPFDYETCDNHPGAFYAVATNLETGKGEAIRVKNMREELDAVWASASLPLLAKIVYFNGVPYLDGGIADSIPIDISREMGNARNVVVLTRDASYRKEPSSMTSIMKLVYGKYPNFIEATKNRHTQYNQTLEDIRAGVTAGNTFVIQPAKPVSVGRLEKDPEKLKALYDAGYEDAKACKDALLTFLNQ